MGKPPSPGPRRYPEDPDAVSLHTTAGESSYADAADEDVLDPGAALLPSYNDAVTESFSNTTTPSAAVGAAIPNEGEFLLGITSPDTHFAFTSDSAFKKRTSIGNEVVHVQDARSDADPQVLEDWIRFMAKYPPAPYLHIRGEHSENRKDKDGKDKRETVTDFRIMINLQNYLWPNFEFQNYSSTKLTTAEPGQKTYRGTVFKTRQTGAKGDLEVGHDKPSLKEWCHRYCAKATGTKVFRLSRKVTGMDTDFLRDRLSGIIRSTNYKGHIIVELPVADRAVDIYSSSRLNNWRLTGWICWIFYLTFLWIFSWPVLFFMTKTYRVVQVEWPFSQMQPDGQKRYTTVSEEQWISRYGPAIKTLCLDRYNGLAGDAFLSEVLARGDVNEANNPVNARAAMSAASAAFQGGRFTAANGANSLMQFAAVATDQVGWGFDT